MKKIEIFWKQLNTSVIATLMENDNPVICEKFYSKLPLKGIQDHALISGEYLYGYIPLPELCSLCHYNAITKEKRSLQNIGRINVSALQHFSIKYGEVSEYLEVTPIAQIDTNDIYKLSEIGKKVWESTFIEKNLIEFYISPLSKKDNGRTEHNIFFNKDIQELVREINLESERIWLIPPDSIKNLFEGKSKNLIGSFGYYYNSIVFADGLMRSLGSMHFGDILRMIEIENIDIEIIKNIYLKVMPSMFIDFLEYCGFNTLFNFYNNSLILMKDVYHREDLKQLILSLINYINKISGWLLHYYPWNLGSQFRRV